MPASACLNPFYEGRDGNFTNDLTRQFLERPDSQRGLRMFGLLFARPTSRIAKEDIIPNLTYFHYRSGNNISVYCAGYRSRIEPQRRPESAPTAAGPASSTDVSPVNFSGLAPADVRTELDGGHGPRKGPSRSRSRRVSYGVGFV
jgi:hypothetical protein